MSHNDVSRKLLLHVVTVQSAERVPSGLQSPSCIKQLLLHVPFTMIRLFLSCRSWSTVGRLTLTSPFSHSLSMAGADGMACVPVHDLYRLLETRMQRMS